jgi:hypothetical protein
MFQYFWAGYVSVFGNMANKNNGDIGFFGEFNQFCRGFPNLGILPAVDSI